MGSKFYFVPGKMENKIIQEKQANHSFVVVFFFNASWFWLLLKKPKMEKPFSIPIWGFVSHQLKRYSIRQGLFSDLYLWQQWRRRHTEQTWGRDGGRRGWEKQPGNMYITKCVMDGQWRFTMWCRELTSEALWQPRGWDGVGGGREVGEGWDICILVADSCWCMAETNTIF